MPIANYYVELDIASCNSVDHSGFAKLALPHTNKFKWLDYKS